MKDCGLRPQGVFLNFHYGIRLPSPVFAVIKGDLLHNTAVASKTNLFHYLNACMSLDL